MIHLQRIPNCKGFHRFTQIWSDQHQVIATQAKSYINQDYHTEKGSKF